MAKLLSSFDKKPSRSNTPPPLKLIADESTPPEIHRVFIEIGDKKNTTDAGTIPVTSLTD